MTVGVLQLFYLTFYLVNLFDDLLDVVAVLLLLQLLFAFGGQVDILQLLSCYFLVFFGLASLVLAHVVLLHLFEQFQVLSFGYFFAADAHVCVGGRDSAHGDVGKV